MRKSKYIQVIEEDVDQSTILNKLKGRARKVESKTDKRKRKKEARNERKRKSQEDV